MSNHTTDIIIIGAGLSGIGAACHLAKKHPNKSYKILEMREELGGTWSLFKYPGVRSDSDMYTFGFSFKPWEHKKSYADASTILEYLDETAKEYKVHEHIIYNQKVMNANFDSTNNTWTIHTLNTKTKEEAQHVVSMIFSCTGYYSYDAGFTPDFKNSASYEGQLIHPQKWPTALDYTDKKVIIIGSGATAITLVPAMAKKTSNITMLQRSPTYIGALPNKDSVGNVIKKILPNKTAHKVIRLKNVTIDALFFKLCMRFPEKLRKFLIKKVIQEIGDESYTPHFTPKYNPWEQRFCLAPDGDFFKTIKHGKATIVTDEIESFTKSGVLLKSGKTLDADIIITATGLKLVAGGNIKLSVDNTPYTISDNVIYKGLMLNKLPNFAFFIGYTNASWTLRSDLTSRYLNRLLTYMDKKKYSYVAPNFKKHKNIAYTPLLDMKSGYFKRGENLFPIQANKAPWKLNQNYFLDFIQLRIKSIKDNYLHFS